MGILDYLSPSILKPALAAAGIHFARVDYDPQSRQVILTIRIHTVTKHIPIPTGRTFSRAEICAALDGQPGAAAPADPPADPHPPPG